MVDGEEAAGFKLIWVVMQWCRGRRSGEREEPAFVCLHLARSADEKFTSFICVSRLAMLL